MGAPSDWGVRDVPSQEEGKCGPQCPSLASSLDWVQSGPACCACGEQIEMSRAVGDVEDQLRSVPRMRPRASVHRALAAGGLAQGAAGGVGSARVPSGAGYRFARPGAPPEEELSHSLFSTSSSLTNGCQDLFLEQKKRTTFSGRRKPLALYLSCK